MKKLTVNKETVRKLQEKGPQPQPAGTCSGCVSDCLSCEGTAVTNC